MPFPYPHREGEIIYAIFARRKARQKPASTPTSVALISAHSNVPRFSSLSHKNSFPNAATTPARAPSQGSQIPTVSATI